jgi:hypothetical protein
MAWGLCAGRVCVSNVFSMTLTVYMCVLVHVLVFVCVAVTILISDIWVNISELTLGWVGIPLGLKVAEIGCVSRMEAYGFEQGKRGLCAWCSGVVTVCGFPGKGIPICLVGFVGMNKP